MTKLNKRRTINEFVNKHSFVIFWDLAFFICKIVDLKTARCNSAVQKKEKGTLMGGRDRKLELSHRGLRRGLRDDASKCCEQYIKSDFTLY